MWSHGSVLICIYFSHIPLHIYSKPTSTYGKQPIIVSAWGHSSSLASSMLVDAHSCPCRRSTRLVPSAAPFLHLHMHCHASGSAFSVRMPGLEETIWCNPSRFLCRMRFLVPTCLSFSGNKCMTIHMDEQSDDWGRLNHSLLDTAPFLLLCTNPKSSPLQTPVSFLKTRGQRVYWSVLTNYSERNSVSQTFKPIKLPWLIFLFNK